jgi:beta-lactamase regulating signal transducer with metallopeptidase domain
MTDLARMALLNAALATALAIPVAVACRFLRRPAVAHALWLLVLLKLLTPPMLGVAILPAAVAAPPPVPAGAARPGATLRTPPPIELTRRPAETSPAPRVPAGSLTGGRRSAPAPVLPRIAGAARAAWIVGALAVLALALARGRRFRRLLRAAEPAPASVQAAATRVSGRLGVRRAPPVLAVDAPISPMLWWKGGRVVLVFPAGLLADLSPAERDALLAHEVAHLRRGDHWVRLLELAASAGFWWLPVSWWARARLRRAEERSCDARVVGALPGAGRAYADALLKTLTFLSGRGERLPALASGVGEARDYEERLTMILKPVATKSLPSIPRLALAAVGIAVLLAFPTRAERERPPAPPRPAAPPLPGAPPLPEAPPRAPLAAPALPGPVAAPAAPAGRAPVGEPPAAPEPAVAHEPSVAPRPGAPPHRPVPPAAPDLPGPVVAPAPPEGPAPVGEPPAALEPAVAPEPVAAPPPGAPPHPLVSPVAPALPGDGIAETEGSVEDRRFRDRMAELEREAAELEARLQQVRLRQRQLETQRQETLGQEEMERMKTEAERLEAEGLAAEAQALRREGEMLRRRLEMESRRLAVERRAQAGGAEAERRLRAAMLDLERAQADGDPARAAEMQAAVAELQAQLQTLHAETEGLARGLANEQLALEMDAMRSYAEALQAQGQARQADEIRRRIAETLAEHARAERQVEAAIRRELLELERHARELEAQGKTQEAEQIRLRIELMLATADGGIQ